MCESKIRISIILRRVAGSGVTGLCRAWGMRVAGLLCAAGLSGCVGIANIEHGLREVIADPSSVHVTNATNAPNTNANENTELSSELLYELLLVDIAVQRGRYKVAMQSLSRAAYRSRHRHIIARAIALAAQLDEHQRVIELSELMATIAPNESRHHLMLANARLESGQSEQAIKMLIDLARKQPLGNESVLQSIAELLAERPADEQLLSRFRRAIEDWQQSPELKLTAALLAAEREQDEIFRALIDAALLLRPDWEVAAMLKLTHLSDFAAQQLSLYADSFLRKFPQANSFRIHYGRLLLHNDEIKKSLAQFEIVLRQEPQSAEALFASGVAYLEQENLSEALARLSRALSLDARNDQARLYIADINIEQADYDSAAVTLHEISAPEYYIDVETRLSFVIAHQDGIDAGIRYSEEIDTLTEAEAVRVILGQERLYRKFDLPEQAKAVLDDALKQMPEHPDLLYGRGMLAAQLNLLELHERDMRALIEQQPDNAHAYNALGYTLADQTERLDEAFELIARALAMKPNDPYILDSMGWVNFRIGNNDKAIEYLRRALHALKSAETAAHLGEALWVAGNRREAREIWQQGKKWSPDNAVLLETMKRFSSHKSSAAPNAKWRMAHTRLHMQLRRLAAPLPSAACAA